MDIGMTQHRSASRAPVLRGATPSKQEHFPQHRLSERQWARIEAVLPGRVSARARNGGNARGFVEAVLWVAQTRAFWSDIPAECGHWHTLYIRFGRWCEQGLWPAAIAAMDGMPEAQAALRALVDKHCANVAARRARRSQRG
jgi:transposase